MDWLGWWGYLASWWEYLGFRPSHVIELILLGVIVWRLRVEREHLKDEVDRLARTLSQRISAVEATVEQASPQAAPAAADNWEKIRQLWAAARERMEYAISQIGDGRKLRKYSNLTRYNYRDIITNLQRDLPLGAEAAGALQAMNERFLRLRRSRSPSQQEAEEFEVYYRRADAALPSPPDNEED